MTNNKSLPLKTYYFAVPNPLRGITLANSCMTIYWGFTTTVAIGLSMCVCVCVNVRRIFGFYKNWKDQFCKWPGLDIRENINWTTGHLFFSRYTRTRLVRAITAYTDNARHRYHVCETLRWAAVAQLEDKAEARDCLLHTALPLFRTVNLLAVSIKMHTSINIFTCLMTQRRQGCAQRCTFCAKNAPK